MNHSGCSLHSLQDMLALTECEKDVYDQKRSLKGVPAGFAEHKASCKKIARSTNSTIKYVNAWKKERQEERHMGSKPFLVC